MRHLLTSVACCAGLALLLACGSLSPDPQPAFDVQRGRIEPAPPAPATTATQASAGIVHDPVQIAPSKSVGYENLPATVTVLFDTPPRPLAVADVVSQTLTNNHQIKIEGYALRVAENEVPASKGIYDLNLGSSLSFNRTEQQSGTTDLSPLNVNSSRTRTGEVALSQLFPTGTVLDFSYDTTRRWNLETSYDKTFNKYYSNPTIAYDHVATLGVTQPLLRGFGPRVTNATIRIAQFEQRGAAADFEAQVTDQLSSSLNTYWALIGAIEAYHVQEISYAAALDLLRVNQSKFDNGIVPRTEVLQAQAAAEERREALIQARQEVRNQEDQLKRQIFLQPDSPQWETQIQPSQPIAWREIGVNQDQAIAEAMALRPELRRAQSNIEQSQVNSDVAKNNLLPQANLFADVSENGLGDGFDEGFRNMESGKYTSYNVGVEFNYPLQNRAARYRYKQANLQVASARESLADTRDQVVQDVRTAVRDLRTARQRIDVTQAAVTSEEAKLEAERKRMEVGLSTAFEVLTFQSDLADAQLKHIQAVIDYNQAAIMLERAMGTLLDSYGVEVAGTQLRPEVKPIGFPVGMN